jgi:hypothetical protein
MQIKEVKFVSVGGVTTHYKTSDIHDAILTFLRKDGNYIHNNYDHDYKEYKVYEVDAK